MSDTNLLHSLSRRRWLQLAAAAVGSPLVGCGGNETTPFPMGLEPLEMRNTAEFPSGRTEDPYPEALNVLYGMMPGRSPYHWVHAKAYIHAPLVQAWAALRDPEICVDRRQITEWMSTPDVEPTYTYSYRNHNIVRNVITIEFDMTWRHGLVEGTTALPTTIAARFAKTSGSTFIRLSEGSIAARAVNANTTSFDFIYHIDAFGQDQMRTEQYPRDYYASVLARVHGMPLPTYR